MKGVILAGGTGTRLYPTTAVTNKHLLPVYNKPMVYYPIEMLKKSGISDLLIIVGGNSVGDFINLLGDGDELGVSITYRHQSKPNGIAGALKLAKEFVGENDFAVCLGDNIFENCVFNLPMRFNLIKTNKPTGMVFLSPTTRASSFGVPTFSDDGHSIIEITEKPKKPASNFAVTGLYIYDKYVWSMIDTLKMSDRNELEITDINNYYIKNGILKHEIVNGWWRDGGSHNTLLEASMLVAGFLPEHLELRNKNEK